jgi:hypothetical protein
MTIVLPALSVAFAAFCVWLTVRIVNRRERWAKRTLLIIACGLPLLYLGSFGAWCWSIGSGPQHTQQWSDGKWGNVNRGIRFYRPILFLWFSGPEPIRSSLDWFANLGTEFRLGVYDYGGLIVVPADLD